VLQISREDAESFGYQDDMPEPLIQTKGYINKRTGELDQIPIGIDPGWHTNPGKFRSETLRAFLAGRLEAASKPLRDAAIQDTASGWLFRLIQERKIIAAKAEVPIGVLAEGQGMRTVMFDTASATDQAGKALTSSDYAAVQPLIDAGTRAVAPDGGLHYLGEVAGRSWRLVIERRDDRFRLRSLDQAE
jgi:hypothetical protein